MAINRVVSTEKATRLLERENKVVLEVDPWMTKDEIKEEVERTFGMKVVSVKTLHTMKNKKRAIVGIHKDHTLDEIASRFGIVV